MNYSTHRPACLCGAGYRHFHCSHCGAEAIPKDRRYRLRVWVIIPLIVVIGVLGWWLAGAIL